MDGGCFICAVMVGVAFMGVILSWCAVCCLLFPTIHTQYTPNTHPTHTQYTPHTPNTHPIIYTAIMVQLERVAEKVPDKPVAAEIECPVRVCMICVHMTACTWLCAYCSPASHPHTHPHTHTHTHHAHFHPHPHPTGMFGCCTQHAMASV